MEIKHILTRLHAKTTGYMYLMCSCFILPLPMACSEQHPIIFSPGTLSRLQDEDPYVRKTAAVCVAKLHDINSALVEDQGFLDLLKDLLSDGTPMVVANAVAALAEISEVSPTGVCWSVCRPSIFFEWFSISGLSKKL